MENNYYEFEKEKRSLDERLEDLEIRHCETEAALTQIKVDVEKT